MLTQIIQNEWRQWRRDGRTVWLAASISVLSLIALVLQISDTKSTIAVREAAQETSRKAWLSQGLKHPHIAAHFGNYAYKHPTVLNVFDPGITQYTGTSVYMEPHHQNDFLFSESGERDTGARFGLFTPSFICQFIIPLLIILLTFNAVVAEKRGGTYALLLAQGVPAGRLLFSKAAAAFLLFASFITVYLILVAIAAYLFIPSPVFSGISFVYLWLAYLLYYAVWCLSGVAVSAQVKSAGTSISLLLLFWIITSIILPRIAASAGENAHPLITNYAFKKVVDKDIANGLDGHDAQSDRAKRIQDSVLKATGTDSVQHLKFNVEGYLMQRSEEYSSNVYDTHFSGIYQTLQQQGRLQSIFSVASPFMMLRNISMAAAGSSLETEILFQRDAEAYRRNFVQTMNRDMMVNSAYGDWDNYKVKKNVYSAVHDFEAPQKPLRWRLGFVPIEQSALLVWILLLAGYTTVISRKNYL